MPTTSPLRTLKLTPWKSSPARPSTSRAIAASAGTVRPAASAKPKLTLSPVIASISRSLGRSATGAETMWRASRSTVTAWQIS